MGSSADQKALAGIYARLSVEKGNAKDNSIENQILLARTWIQGQPELQEGGCYIDLGFSGRTFQRPQLRKMFQDMERGRLQCLVVKDLSRFGRDYLTVGEYLEKIFPRMGIRVVSLGEGYDSRNQMPGSLEGGIRNLMNEWYARDIGRKVRMAKAQQRQEGCYLGSCAPYGFRIVRKDGKRVLEEDDGTGEILLQMNELYLEGRSYREIQTWLLENGIATPAQYRKSGCIRMKSPCTDISGKRAEGTPRRTADDDAAKKWDVSSIKRILNFAHQRGLLPGSEQSLPFRKQI